jgi:exosortase/archaeosortase
MAGGEADYSVNWLEGVRKLAAIGGWAVVSLFFLAQMAGYIPNPVEARIITHDESMKSFVDRLVIAMRVMCENGSKTQAEYNNCRNIR